MAAPLSLSHGTLVRRSTPVENHCFKVSQGLRHWTLVKEARWLFLGHFWPLFYVSSSVFICYCCKPIIKPAWRTITNRSSSKSLLHTLGCEGQRVRGRETERDTRDTRRGTTTSHKLFFELFVNKVSCPLSLWGQFNKKLRFVKLSYKNNIFRWFL